MDFTRVLFMLCLEVCCVFGRDIISPEKALTSTELSELKSELVTMIRQEMMEAKHDMMTEMRREITSLKSQLTSLKASNTASDQFNTVIAFTVKLLNTYAPGTDDKVAYDVIETNVGAGYYPERNEFVCADPGVYAFYANMNASSGQACHMYIAKNGVEVARMWASNPSSSTGSNMAVLELEQGDAVAVRSGGCGLNGSNPYNTFSGFKINGMDSKV